jgi:xanthosine utilization system XapX-like protein
MVMASYDVSRRGLLLFWAAACLAGGLVLDLVALLIVRRSVLEAVILIGFLGMNIGYAYYFAFRVIWRVELTPTGLRWRHAVGGGAAELADVRSIRCAKVPGREADMATVEFVNRGQLKFSGKSPGVTEFLARVHDYAPQVTVEAPLS